MQRPGINPTARGLLTRARIDRGWSQRELADLIGTNYVNISRWERGSTRPGPYFRQRLCILFGKSEQELDLLESDESIRSKISELPTIASTPSLVNGHTENISELILQKDIEKAAQVPLYDPLIPHRSALSLVGRDTELAQLRGRLCGGHSVALTALNGLPGVGKTALSIALVEDAMIRDYFRDGILWAGLGPKPNLSSMLSRWEKMLEVPEVEMAELGSNEERARAIRTVLGSKRMLVVIDDVWTEEQVKLFKVGGPHCAHLITTRFPVLATQFAPDSAFNIRELGEKDSMKLLSTLAPDVVQEEAKRAQDLITAVGGLPLALTLIGNYLRTQSHNKQRRRINAALDHLSHAQERLQLSELQDAAEGHSSLESDEHLSLQSVFAVTVRQLDPQIRHALYALSIFPAKPNTFSEKAALYVANCGVDTLDMLSDAGLLESSDNERYTLHQTIADYARMHLRDKDVHERFLYYITEALENHEKDYDVLERDNPLVYATLDLSYTTGKQDYLIRAVLAFTPYLLSRGLYQQAKEHLQRAYEAAQQRKDTAHITKSLLYLGRIAQKQGEYTQAENHFQVGLTLARKVEDHEAICSLLTDLGSMTWKRGEYERAEACLQEALPLAQEIRQSSYVCVILDILGSIAARQGNYTQAEHYLREGLVIARDLKDREQTCMILTNLGVTVGEQGQYEQSEVYLKEGLVLAQQIGHREWMCGLLSNLGVVSVELKQFIQAEAYFKEGIVLARQLGQQEWISMLLLNLGLATRKLKNYQQAKEHLQESLEVARQLGIAQITADSLYEYGNLLLDLQLFDSAEESFDEMLSIAPDGSQNLIALAQYGLAQALAAQGKNDEARRLGEESVSMLTAIGHRNITEVREWLLTLMN